MQRVPKGYVRTRSNPKIPTTMTYFLLNLKVARIILLLINSGDSSPVVRLSPFFFTRLFGGSLESSFFQMAVFRKVYKAVSKPHQTRKTWEKQASFILAWRKGCQFWSTTLKNLLAGKKPTFFLELNQKQAFSSSKLRRGEKALTYQRRHFPCQNRIKSCYINTRLHKTRQNLRRISREKNFG